jgi:hypothetical protein
MHGLYTCYVGFIHHCCDIYDIAVIFGRQAVTLHVLVHKEMHMHDQHVKVEIIDRQALE